jgi:phenylalanyl-tRNA synthetase alpha chain
MGEIDLNQKLDELKQIKNSFEQDLAACSSPKELEQVRIKYLSKKGLLQSQFSLLGKLPPEDRPAIGRELNTLRTSFQQALKSRAEELEQLERQKEKIDVTLPGYVPFIGRLHPITQTLEEIKDIFSEMGFSIEEGPEVETDYYNFEALNIPPDHPAREMHDTFYLDNRLLLRTHTSPVQIRVMEKREPPIRMIAPGRCYRKDTPDASHSPFFHQVEGLCVDTDVSFADLKGIIAIFAKKMFGEDVKIRFRPSYFPFTEPSAECDMTCIICKGEGCKTCKNSGWLEISGAGMVDPEVFRYVGYDPEKYSGYAFGMGVERIAMLKYGINDIRYFFDNDLRFLEQF